MLHVVEVNQISELAPYRLCWQGLLSQTRYASFFQSLDWLEVYWHHFSADQQLRILFVQEAGHPVGILPLVVRTESTRAGQVRVLTYPLHGWGSFYAPLGPNPTATLYAALRHIRNTPRNWDVLDLRWVDQTRLDHGRTERAMQTADFATQQQPWERTGIIEMNTSWETYWASRNSKWRKNTTRVCRKLKQAGQVSLLRYRPKGQMYGDDDPRWDLYDTCVQLAQRSWQGTSSTGTTLSHPEVAQYFHDAHEAAVALGAVDLNLLLIDEKPAAFIYNYIWDGRLYGVRRGFEPTLSEDSPGTVLERMLLEDSFRRGDTEFDMGVGSLRCKRYWLTSLVDNYRYAHYPMKSVRGQALRLKRFLSDRFGSRDEELTTHDLAKLGPSSVLSPLD